MTYKIYHENISSIPDHFCEEYGFKIIMEEFNDSGEWTHLILSPNDNSLIKLELIADKQKSHKTHLKELISIG